MKNKRKILLLALNLLLTSVVISQNQDTTASSTAKKEKGWYEKISIKGYAQVRYNRLLETNPDLNCDQCDKSIGDNNGFFIRRARLTFSGKLNDHVYFYFQPDWASNVAATQQHFLQVRDVYLDLGIDKEMVYRFRIGQSKVPFGFENLQSSSNRLALDRADAINSAAPNERDLGVFFYWTPKVVQETFKKLGTNELKGTGNYGVFGIGAYNGQSANVAEANNNRHLAARLAYPFTIGSQIVEGGLQAYSGNFVVRKNTGTKGAEEVFEYRYGANIILYPQPFGFQAEYNFGKGPAYNPAPVIQNGVDPNANAVIQKGLEGGYAQIMYNLKIKNKLFIPYFKYQYYKGGKKHEVDARYYDMTEIESGIEWHFFNHFELTTAYTIADRFTSDGKNPSNQQRGNFLRLQAQVYF